MVIMNNNNYDEQYDIMKNIIYNEEYDEQYDFVMNNI